ncbi:MAG: hypothetical protein LBC73_04835 [Oscillospiraceae bacterium]|jgi:hypothetical protein|nr:hypothetical protein [Oscillospiraceae bacterium]
MRFNAYRPLVICEATIRVHYRRALINEIKKYWSEEILGLHAGSDFLQ